MESGRLFKLFVIASASMMLIFSRPVVAEQIQSVDNLLKLTAEYLGNAPSKALPMLAQLKEQQLNFTKTQAEQFNLLQASSLGFQNRHKERIAIVLSGIEQVSNSELRVKFLYELADAYSNLGEHENSWETINEIILLLPQLSNLKARITGLQSVVSSYLSLHAYEEALIYADRISALPPNGHDVSAQCIGKADQIEINFLLGRREIAHLLKSDALRICDKNGLTYISLLVKTLDAIDQIDSGMYSNGIKVGLPLLLEFSKTNQTSDYVTQLEEAIARAYLKNADLQLAERYGLQAYQHAQNSKVLQMMEKTSETMAKIKRAQGNMVSALDYYDINLALKKKVLDDQLHKNLAYQRVKFDTQDKANQLSLLEQKNKILSTEKKLEQRNNQNLLMLIALGAILMVILSAWTFKVLRQKNLFRLSSQIDGLTQVSNRAHFVACGMQQFEKTEGSINVILFDMDHFKNINDSFGHAVGDWVLKAVSASVKSLLPKAEMLGRLGGEEFAICLPKLNQLEALALAEQCRAAIAAIDSSPSGFAFPVTASFGVACRGMRGLREFEDTLAAADKALYFSKTEGRNRVSLYQ